MLCRCYIFFPTSWRFVTTLFKQVCCCSIAKLCLTLCDPMNHSAPGLSVHHQLPELAQTHVQSVMPSNHLILCHPLLLPPSIFPSIRVFSSESAVPIRWPKDWSLSFNISPSNEHSGLSSFRTDWFGGIGLINLHWTTVDISLHLWASRTRSSHHISSPRRPSLTSMTLGRGSWSSL